MSVIHTSNRLLLAFQVEENMETATQITNVFIIVGVAAMLIGYAVWWKRKKSG